MPAIVKPKNAESETPSTIDLFCGAVATSEPYSVARLAIVTLGSDVVGAAAREDKRATALACLDYAERQLSECLDTLSLADYYALRDQIAAVKAAIAGRA